MIIILRENICSCWINVSFAGVFNSCRSQFPRLLSHGFHHCLRVGNLQLNRKSLFQSANQYGNVNENKPESGGKKTGAKNKQSIGYLPFSHHRQSCAMLSLRFPGQKKILLHITFAVLVTCCTSGLLKLHFPRDYSKSSRALTLMELRLETLMSSASRGRNTSVITFELVRYLSQPWSPVTSTSPAVRPRQVAS